jgi:hypothetical protein
VRARDCQRARQRTAVTSLQVIFKLSSLISSGLGWIVSILWFRSSGVGMAKKTGRGRGRGRGSLEVIIGKGSPVESPVLDTELDTGIFADDPIVCDIERDRVGGSCIKNTEKGDGQDIDLDDSGFAEPDKVDMVEMRVEIDEEYSETGEELPLSIEAGEIPETKSDWRGLFKSDKNLGKLQYSALRFLEVRL